MIVDYEVKPVVIEALDLLTYNAPQEMCESCAYSIQQHGHAVCGCTLFLPKVT